MSNARVVIALVCVSAGAAGGAEFDKSLFPKAYGVLGTERLLFPVDMRDWPVRIDSRHQLLVDDYLISSRANLTRLF